MKNTLLVAIGLGLIGSAIPAFATPNVIHRWSFSETSGTNVSDSVGGATGHLMRLLDLSTTNYVGTPAILDGSQVTLAGDGAYVDFPNGLVSGLTNVTFEFWVTWDGTAEWERIFSFGSMITNGNWDDDPTNWVHVEDINGSIRGRDADVNNGYDTRMFTGLFCTPNYGGSGGNMRFTASDQWWNAERPVLNDPLPVTPNTELHLVVTYGSGGARMFYDGLQTADGYPPNFLQLSNIVDINNWLGRAQYNDQMYAGSFNEFRLHDTLLTAQEVYASYNSFNPDGVTYDPGASSGLTMSLKDNMILGGIQTPTYTAVFANLGASAIDLYSPDVDKIESSDTNVLAIVYPGRVEAVGVGTATVTATLGTDSVNQTITVTTGVSELKHRWSFNETPGSTTLIDSVGDANGTVVPSSTTNVTLTGTEVSFPGGGYATGPYVDLADGIVSSRTNITIEGWFTWRGPAGSWWQRVFDFGSSQKAGGIATNSGNGIGYLFLTTYQGTGARFDGRPDTGTGGFQCDNTIATSVDVEHHFAAIYAPESGLARLYFDGIPITQTADWALSEISDTNNWLGASQWNDNNFNGSINELRVYEGVLTDLGVAISRAAGPDVENPVPPGNLNSVSVPDVDLLLGAPGTAQAILLGNFDNYSNVDISGLSGVLFSGDDSNVVTVTTSGLITQVGAGTANLSGSYSGLSDVGTVSVLTPISLELQLTNDFFLGGPTAQATLLATYNGYTNVDASGYGVTYDSSDTNVATVSAAGVVTPVGVGSATISATYGGQNTGAAVNVLGPTSIELQLASSVKLYGNAQATLLANYSGYPNIDATGFGVDWTSANAGVATVNGNGTVYAQNTGSATISATYGGLTDDAVVTVYFPSGYEATLQHRYSFTTAVEDSVGTADGTLSGTATVTGGELVLDGAATSWAELPAAGVVLSNYTGLTIEAWATPSSSTVTWSTLFGAGQTNPVNADLPAKYTLLQTHRGDNVTRFSVTPSLDDTPYGEEDFADGPEYNDDVQHHYVGVLYDNGGIALFTDGVLREVGILNNAPQGPAVIANQWLRIGQGGYVADGTMVGSVNELRIYEGILTPSQVQAAYALGPDALPGPVLTIRRALPNVIVSWPSSATGFTLEAAPDITGPYSSSGLPAPVVVGNELQVTVPATSATRYFRLR